MNVRLTLLSTAFTAIVSAALFAVFPVFPPLTYAAAVAAPFFVAQLAWTASARHATVAVLLAAVVLALAIEPDFALQYLVPFGVTGIFVGMGLKREWQPERIIGAAMWTTVLTFAAFMGAMAFNEGISPLAYLERAAMQEMAPFKKALSDEKLDPEMLLALQSGMEQAQRLMGRAALGIVAGFTILTAWLNALWVRQSLLRRGHPLPSWVNWRAPETWVWGLIAAGGLIALGDETLSAIGLNLFLPLALIYFLQGLAILESLFEAKAVSRFVRGILYALVFVQLQIAAPVLALAGVFDLWIDFRSRWTPPADSAGADEKQNTFRNEGGS